MIIHDLIIIYVLLLFLYDIYKTIINICKPIKIYFLTIKIKIHIYYFTFKFFLKNQKIKFRNEFLKSYIYILRIFKISLMTIINKNKYYIYFIYIKLTKNEIFIEIFLLYRKKRY